MITTTNLLLITIIYFGVLTTCVGVAVYMLFEMFKKWDEINEKK